MGNLSDKKYIFNILYIIYQNIVYTVLKLTSVSASEESCNPEPIKKIILYLIEIISDCAEPGGHPIDGPGRHRLQDQTVCPGPSHLAQCPQLLL